VARLTLSDAVLQPLSQRCLHHPRLEGGETVDAAKGVRTTVGLPTVRSRVRGSEVNQARLVTASLEVQVSGGDPAGAP
jgi:hypothetical protein